MIFSRNTKTMEDDEEAAVAAKKKKNTTAYLYFHKFSRFSNLKSLFRFTFVSKLWYNTIHDYLPTVSDDIIFFHILTRLPSKSLLRFSCVSKLWYNTIHHDPFFIDSHYNHSKSNPSLVLISATSSETHFNFNYLDQEQHQGASSSSYTLVANFKNNRTQVIGSVNGLTCFSTIYFIEVCNPSTHEILGIPYPPKWKILDPCRYGFGFDPLVNQYKVLRVTDSVCQICTLGAGMNRSNCNTQDCIWRDITDTSHLPLHECRMKLEAPPYVFASGALFRVISSANIIVLFDIHYEKFQVIPGLQVCHDRLRLYTICEFRGCPCAVYCADIVDGYEFSLCALKKQQSSSNSNVGSIYFVFEQKVRFPFKTLTNNLTLSFTEYSGHILLQWYDNTDEMHFYVYNPHTERLQKEVSGSSSCCFNALFVKHIDNLLSLKKLVPLSPPGAPVNEVRYLSSREATMHDEGSPTTLSLKSTLCCVGSSAKKHQHQDMNQWGHYIYMSRFKSR